MKKIATVIIALLVVACASPKPSATPSNSENKTAATTSPASGAVVTSSATPSVPTPASTASSSTGSDASSKMAADVRKPHNESVYFDYNEFTVKSEFKSVIEEQAENIKNHKNAAVVLEGNADERGSAAYNLALGEKRSTSVKKLLVTLGIPASQIKVVSFGKSKPKMDCHEEKCWQENRRVDFVIK